MAGRNNALTAVRFFAALLLGLVFHEPLPARAQPQPPPGKSQEASGPPANAADRAQIALRKLRQCQISETEPFDPPCAVKIYKEAGQILEAGGVTEFEAPHLWWFIYEGIGVAVAQSGRLPEAREFFQKAGAIERLPADAREESAYFLAVADYRLGNKEAAWHAFDVLFSQNSDWLAHAESDPAIADVREEASWKELAERHHRRLQGKEPEHEPGAAEKE